MTDPEPQVNREPSALQKRYVGALITVYYRDGQSDTGTVTYIDDHWVEVEKYGFKERLLIPAGGARLIRVIKGPVVQDADSLLRPSEPQPPQPKG